MNQKLQLKESEAVGKGHSRLVFRHPDEPRWVVKVIRPDVIEERFGGGISWYKFKRRYGRYISYVREIQEYIAVWSEQGAALSFLQKVIGLVDTDLGLGLVLEAGLDREGNLAPHVAALIERGEFTSKVRGDLEAFMRQLESCDVIVSDMNVGNMVYAYTEELGDHFVLIDGLGVNNILPLKTLSRRLNLRSKRKRFARLYMRIGQRLEKAGHAMPPLPEDMVKDG